MGGSRWSGRAASSKVSFRRKTNEPIILFPNCIFILFGGDKIRCRIISGVLASFKVVRQSNDADFGSPKEDAPSICFLTCWTH
jgi:hypothetical protein